MIFVSNCLLTALTQQNRELVFNAKEVTICNLTHVFQSIPTSLIAGYTVRSQMSPPVFIVSSDSLSLLENACKYLPFALWYYQMATVWAVFLDTDWVQMFALHWEQAQLILTVQALAMVLVIDVMEIQFWV